MLRRLYTQYAVHREVNALVSLEGILDGCQRCPIRGQTQGYWGHKVSVGRLADHSRQRKAPICAPTIILASATRLWVRGRVQLVCCYTGPLMIHPRASDCSREPCSQVTPHTYPHNKGNLKHWTLGTKSARRIVYDVWQQYVHLLVRYRKLLPRR